jgi:hypothetical protein
MEWVLHIWNGITNFNCTEFNFKVVVPETEQFCLLLKHRQLFILNRSCLKQQNNFSIKHCTRQKLFDVLKICRVLFGLVLNFANQRNSSCYDEAIK